MARRRVDVFSLAFLDAMTCGFGAVVLFFMIINAAAGLRSHRVTADLSAEVDRLEEEVLDGHRGLVVLRNAVAGADQDLAEAHGLSRRLLEALEDTRVELAAYDGETLANREHVNRLMADLKSLEEDVKRLGAKAAEEDETPGDRVRSFVGDGDRQYLTGLKVGGQRILILVDASASMLADTVVNVIRRRNLPDETKRRAEKWQQAVSTVDWLTTQIPRESRFQLFVYRDDARPVVPETQGTWLSGGDAKSLNQAVTGLREVVPGGGTSLYHAVEAIHSLSPQPDNVILLTDSLPTRGKSKPRGNTVSGKQRRKLFDEAMRRVPTGIPINVILLPMEGDPDAASSYWKLALATRGSLLTPSEDWP